MVSNLAPFGEATVLTNCATVTEQYFWASKTVAISSATHPKWKYYSLIKGKVVAALTNKIILPCSLTQNSRHRIKGLCMWCPIKHSNSTEISWFICFVRRWTCLTVGLGNSLQLVLLLDGIRVRWTLQRERNLSLTRLRTVSHVCQLWSLKRFQHNW